METARFGKNVRSVVQLQTDSDGTVTPVVLHKSDSKRKKTKGPLGILDRAVRQVSLAHRAMTDSYVARHDQSNRKKRDGWLTELPVNIIRANQKGLKKLRLIRLISS